MVYITEELVRQRAEHNDGELFSLEELSLHQQNLEKIQHLDHWCRELRILLLQNNVIQKIENVGRLKKLEYLNLALNNIEVIENLEGCESLQKLDLTLNFVGRLSSVSSLSENVHLKELFLVGNPCVDFEGYRKYVVTALPQLQSLDGQDISRSERLQAAQGLDSLRAGVHRQEEEYVLRREREKEEAREKDEAREEPGGQQRRPGFDGRWYTDISRSQSEEQQQESSGSQEEQDFWNSPCSHTPEARLEAHRRMEQSRRNREKAEGGQKQAPPPPALVGADGRVLNVNQSRLDFLLTEDEENNTIVLDLAVYRHLDSSLIEVDVQPLSVRVTVKGKVFQVVLPAEVQADSSSAQRSQTTGHLLLTMPRAEGHIRVKKNRAPVQKPHREAPHKTRAGPELLEVDPGGLLDWTNIVKCPGTERPQETRPVVQSEPSGSCDSDPEMPPLI